MMSRLSWPPGHYAQERACGLDTGRTRTVCVFPVSYISVRRPAGTSTFGVDQSDRLGGPRRRLVPGIPVAVEWRDLTWSKPGGASIAVQMMRLNVGVIGLLMGQQSVDALVQFPGGGQAEAGKATGTVSAASWSFIGPVSFKGHAQQIDLAALIKPHVTKGILQADIVHRWENRGKEGIAFKGDGSWRAEVKELVLERNSYRSRHTPLSQSWPCYGCRKLS